MREECEHWLRELGPERLKALEISGRNYASLGFASYQSTRFPEFDLCAGMLDDTFDVIIAEQVFEHLLWPYRAGRNAYAMLRSGGHLLVSTPFLVRLHPEPVDCTRWSEIGLRYFLAECGFGLDEIRTSSWGNRDCINANFHGWTKYRRRLHSLVNEPLFPYHVWALARK